MLLLIGSAPKSLFQTPVLFPFELMSYVYTVDKFSRFNHRKKPIDNVKDINQQILLCCGLSCLPQGRLHQVLIQGYVAAVSMSFRTFSPAYIIILFIHVSMCYDIKLSSAKTLKIITWILCAWKVQPVDWAFGADPKQSGRNN